MDHIDENYIHNLSVCYRCGTPVEPLVSEQWFINVNKKVRGKSLKQRSIEVVKNGEIKILPDLFNKTYFHWMENLRDWCISRQIWWGHQIPVWYCVTKKKRMCAKPIVALETPKHCPYCLGNKLQQDPDTLDTWFSSGLWTFSTLGWPQRTKDLANFHPTSVLETGYDILFFWVARMILLTTYLLDEIPFKTVYLHGLVRDKQGLKMSKSLGNGIDPLDMIDKYGTDAVRLSLVLGSSPGNDMRLYEEKIAGYRNFVNKIWNGARFVLLNLDKDDFRKKIDYKSLAKIDQWILHRTNEVVKQASKGIEEYRFSEVGLMIYDFFWSEYCDWYVEMSKITQNKAVLAYVLKTVLALLHPFIPFISEKIWELIGEKELLMVSNWPSVNPKNNFPFSKREIKQIIEVVSVIRQSRAEYHLSPAEKIKVTLYGHGLASTLNLNLAIIKQLARVDELVIKEKGEKLKGCLGQFVGNIEVYLHIADLIDISKECERLQKELENVSQYLDRLKKKVTNKQYLRNAPKLIIEQDKHNFDESLSRQKNLVAQLKNLM
ncbi:MAG: valyl-tRNA synthetase, valyl-tRNA synthetase [Candidatus Peregrinibacteria bacterium GW2011_GWE2_39_6]|nr:MAG: valyl-tRNA synthetase, valyl-tRNA synthetase [Candidatus Peregrinibacteria bacterium GW2011_GWE2_39_6]